ncbi:MAG: energy-coupling factor transporter transmembrane protein EcfT [Clostridiales bacterium]|nr:energy-coupling factor transporter transmembrane protein EcfT [Clostridiales bacterium]
MLKDITLGQYFPGHSFLHRLDPRNKIVLTFLFIVALFLAKSMLSFALVVVFTAVLIIISGISFKVLLKGLKPLLFIIVFTMILNLFFTKGADEAPIISFYFIHIYRKGITYAVYMIIRIVCLLAGTGVLLTYTTSPIALTDGIEQLFAPLSKIKVPVHEFAMMMTIALGFIPTLVEETDKIMSAQKSRGADFSSGGLIKRSKALIPILIPLFVNSFKRAYDLATAMECRCYRGGEGRTRMNRLHFGGLDVVGLSLLIVFCAGILLLNYFTMDIGYGL